MEICEYTGLPTESVRKELVRLYHQMVIRIVGMRPSYDGIRRNYVWRMTRHGRDHFYPVDGCTACKLRNRRILRAGGMI